MQTYYQCYWNKTSEENIRILRMFGESEEAVVPEMIAGRAVVEAGDYCFAVSGTSAGRVWVHGLHL